MSKNAKNHLKSLKSGYETALAEAQGLMAAKDSELDAVRKRYDAKLRKANDKAAAAQKVWADAEAAAALSGRWDAKSVAEDLGLTLPDA